MFTDGHETADKTIAAAAAAVTSRVFAIGLGTPDQLDPGALSDIAAGTGGHLLLTGNPGPDDQVRLQKYFAQVLAGVTNAAIVVDPDGFVPIGAEVRVPFDLTAADIRADVIVLGEATTAVDVVLEAPDGSIVAPGAAGTEEVVGTSSRFVRLRPTVAAPSAASGRWTAVLRVDERRLQAWVARLRERLADSQDDRAGQLLERVLGSVRTHGVPFTLTVQARSALRLGVELAQSTRLPGSTATLRATLTDSGIPLVGSARVEAHVTAPDGSRSVRPLSPDGDGHVAAISTTVSGAYEVRVVARGEDLRGVPFTREELRTLPVWPRGDDRPPLVVAPVDDGRRRWCELLTCLLRQDGVRKLLERNEIDADAIGRCLERLCGRGGR